MKCDGNCYFFYEGDDDYSGNGTRPHCKRGHGLWRECKDFLSQDNKLGILKYEAEKLRYRVEEERDRLSDMEAELEELDNQIEDLESQEEVGAT